MFNNYVDCTGMKLSLCEVKDERNIHFDCLVDKYTYHNDGGLVEIDTPKRPKKGDFIWHSDGVFRLLERFYVLNNFKLENN